MPPLEENESNSRADSSGQLNGDQVGWSLRLELRAVGNEHRQPNRLSARVIECGNRLANRLNAHTRGDGRSKEILLVAVGSDRDTAAWIASQQLGSIHRVPKSSISTQIEHRARLGIPGDRDRLAITTRKIVDSTSQ